MRKLAWISFVVIAVAATTVWANSPGFNKRTTAGVETADGISPEALLRQIDVKSLPVLEGPAMF